MTRKALLLLFIFSLAGNCFAQTDEELGIPKGVQVSPSRFDWDMKVPDQRTGVINLKNFSKEKSFEVEVQVEDFYVSDDSTEAKFFVPGENHPLRGYDVINWIEIPEKKFFLGPGENREVKFFVKVPEGTPTGGYYGALFFLSKVQEITDISGEESRLVVNQRVGALLVMAVKGDEPIRRTGELRVFIPRKKVFFQKPAEFLARVENSGNLHFKALGKFQISKFGKTIVKTDLPARVLYPQKTREYLQTWDFSPWSYGFYRAKINFISEDGEIAFGGEASFWVIPWKTTAAIFAILALVYLILKIFSTKFEIRKKTSGEEGAEAGEDGKDGEGGENGGGRLDGLNKEKADADKAENNGKKE